MRVDCVLKNTHIPVSFWRSVGSSQNAFVIESFIDEMAHASGRIPYSSAANCSLDATISSRCSIRSPRRATGAKPLASGNGPRHRHPRMLWLDRRRSRRGRGEQGRGQGRAGGRRLRLRPRGQSADRGGAARGRHHLRPVGGALRREYGQGRRHRREPISTPIRSCAWRTRPRSRCISS